MRHQSPRIDTNASIIGLNSVLIGTCFRRQFKRGNVFAFKAGCPGRLRFVLMMMMKILTVDVGSHCG